MVLGPPKLIFFNPTPPPVSLVLMVTEHSVHKPSKADCDIDFLVEKMETYASPNGIEVAQVETADQVASLGH